MTADGSGAGEGWGQAAPGSRSAAQLRSDIVEQRQELGRSVNVLRSRWIEATDLGLQVRRHRAEIVAGALAVGAVAGAAVALGRRRS